MKLVGDALKDAVSKLESEGDGYMSKKTFFDSMSAMGCYNDAMHKLYDALHDESIDDGDSLPHFKTHDADARAWYLALCSKLKDATANACR